MYMNKFYMKKRCQFCSSFSIPLLLDVVYIYGWIFVHINPFGITSGHYALCLQLMAFFLLQNVAEFGLSVINRLFHGNQLNPKCILPQDKRYVFGTLLLLSLPYINRNHCSGYLLYAFWWHIVYFEYKLCRLSTTSRSPTRIDARYLFQSDARCQLNFR